MTTLSERSPTLRSEDRRPTTAIAEFLHGTVLDSGTTPLEQRDDARRVSSQEADSGACGRWSRRRAAGSRKKIAMSAMKMPTPAVIPWDD